jgi:ABC-type antimicrobial peptide transport system permease subunit
MKENPKSTRPPRWADWLLECYCPNESLEEVQGDLRELYTYWINTDGKGKARRRYVWNVLRLLRPFKKKQKSSGYSTSNKPDMIRSYFKIAFRNLRRHQAYSFINMAGLSVGMAVAMLIGLWIGDELSFDRYHPNYNWLAQVMGTQTFNNEVGTAPNIVVPIENELRTKYASDFKRLSLTWTSTNVLAVGEKKLSRSGRWAQPDLPLMLSLRLLSGSYEAFRDPSSILLSQSVATALFGDADPVNQVVRVDNRNDMKVAGVYEDLPRNTTFYETKFLLPWDNQANWWNTQTDAWSNHGCELFVQVNERVDFAKTSAKIRLITQEHGYKESNEQLFLHPMARWNLYSEFKNGQEAGGRIQFVWLFGIIGGFVLLLACINFMNLSTARSEKRAKEVGIRKAVGSVRGQLIGQFLCESIVVAGLAFVLSLILVQLSLAFFNDLADKAVAIPWKNPEFWLYTLGFTIFTGLISGSYPALYLSGFNPVTVLKGTFRAGRAAVLPRQVLVVLQFTVSITLIIGTLIVFRQIQFAKSRPVGYTPKGLITVVMNTPELYKNYNGLRKDLIQSGGAQDMAQSNSAPTQIWSNNNGVQWEGKDPNVDPNFGTIAVTHDFGRTVGWEIVAGRDFSREYPTDSGGFILNESAVKVTGLKDPIGKVMKWAGKDHIVTGVVKDMIMNSPYQPTVPTIFHMEYVWVNMITVRINPAMPFREALKKIEPVFKKYNPGGSFDYQFTDEEYAKKFANEERMGNLATVFAVLAIFISCLGLFGLASFVAEQRTKEIGIRKVLGATVFNLWSLLSKEFVALVLISCLIAIPIAWHFLNQWLQNYTYRTELSWWIFAAAGFCALVITLLTVSYQAIRAALANPVKSLRTE